MFLWALSMGSNIIIISCQGQPNGTVITTGTIFDVTNFGALGDGVTDDSLAFLAAWKAICRLAGEPKLIIPGGNRTYLLSPTSFEGPCKCVSLYVEIAGEIIAPNAKWSVSHKDTWLNFKHVNGLFIHGNRTGRLNGRGSGWWQDLKADTGRPTALRFEDCRNLRVDGLNHVDPQRNHISITECDGAILSNLNINAPSTSPNTDGIDIANSRNIQIHDLQISTGDDCIAINGGSYQINITRVTCGPGHGISIGSLGKDGKREEVEDVHVSDCTFDQTENGVRIKTWQGGSGFAKSITFTGIRLHASNNPIIIDQFYCPHEACDDKGSAVEVSGITYSGINGTSINTEAISFNCSHTLPCSKIVLEDINIIYVDGSSPTSAYCINAHGIISHSITTNITCLEGFGTSHF